MTAHLIAKIHDPMVQDLARRGIVRTYPRHSVLVNEGDRSDSLYVVLGGRVKVFVAEPSGREMVLGFLGPGEYFGEMSLDGSPRSASVVAVEPTTCSIVGHALLREAIVADPDVAMNLISKLIERARTATESVKTLALMDVYGRVARLLRSLAVEQPDGTAVVPQRMTQQDIADRVGASRDMVSRIFKELTAGGYVSVADRTITLHRKPPARW